MDMASFTNLDIKRSCQYPVDYRISNQQRCQNTLHVQLMKAVSQPVRIRNRYEKAMLTDFKPVIYIL